MTPSVTRIAANQAAFCASGHLCRTAAASCCSEWSTAEAYTWRVAGRANVKQQAPDTDQATLLGCCSGVVFTVLFHPKDLMLFSGGEDSDVRVWDLNTKSCVATLKVRPWWPALLQAHSPASGTQDLLAVNVLSDLV